MRDTAGERETDNSLSFSYSHVAVCHFSTYTPEKCQWVKETECKGTTLCKKNRLSPWDAVLQPLWRFTWTENRTVAVTVITAKGYYVIETGERHYRASQQCLLYYRAIQQCLLHYPHTSFSTKLQTPLRTLYILYSSLPHLLFVQPEDDL